ncbi:MAG: 2-oxo acid dehydrogenase subunit E2 [Bacteroidales bacterium]|jgi:2-oxoglutarate dehydrogenase E2 component (dihydrolipoamide succinyltransferase)|nr:2-oxo acid dehydrogenase subunit E2 [Bacteroidales bacterium]
MTNFEIIMPKMGESVIEATIIRWLKKEGEIIKEDDPICEIATDKVDSEIPSPVEGVLKKILFAENDVVPVGTAIAIIDMGGEDAEEPVADKPEKPAEKEEVVTETTAQPVGTPALSVDEQVTSTRFYSPLVKSIAKEEKISIAELETIPGSGKNGRLTKDDLLQYIKNRQQPVVQPPAVSKLEAPKVVTPPVTVSGDDEVFEMDRMRRLIADHMVQSVHTSPHVTSFIEVDVTNVVKWRESIKDSFLKREGEKITYMPIFIEATAKVLKEFPNVNASVDGYKVIRRKKINIGMATALPNGNLIVPVIKNADQKNLIGLAKDVNSLANKARNSKLNPDDIQGGTFTITNFGTFDSITGTPIINQPQVAILGIGAIKKKPVVLETKDGDVIAVRHMMILSLSYDHRIVDGALGGMFIRRIAQLLENFDTEMTI